VTNDPKRRAPMPQNLAALSSCSSPASTPLRAGQDLPDLAEHTARRGR